MQREEIHRYTETNFVWSQLNPLEDVMCWIEGLTSVSYVEELLNSKHSLQGPMSTTERSQTVAKLVNIACKYLEQAENGPKEVSFLPLYYAFLHILKAYITIGPYAHELKDNRFHGASYNANRDFKSLEDDFITLHANGAIPLFYRTLVGENMFREDAVQQDQKLNLNMGDVYPYILNISAEYKMATGEMCQLKPFDIAIVTSEKEGKQRVEATYLEENEIELDDALLSTLQGFKQLHIEAPGRHTLVSDWHEKGSIESPRTCLRPAMFYGRTGISPEQIQSVQYVPSSRGKLWFPEELPLICAFYHMSNVVRYDPDTLTKLMDSKYWPMLLTLRKHGTYRFLVLFWSFVTQCSTYLVGA